MSQNIVPIQSAGLIQGLRDRARVLRIHTLKMIHRSKASHLGSCLSMADLITCLYWNTLRIDPVLPASPGRDRFFLSKGHGAAILYAALAERGFFPIAELDSYCQNGSRLTGHVTSGVPGVELSSGSLGHGLPVACGIALAAKRENLPFRTFVLLSDGELDEGSNWEAILFAPQHKLDNLVVIIDYNKIQSFGSVKDVLDLDPLADKFRAFRWSVKEVDGHDMEELVETFHSLPLENSRPTAIIAHTVKGKGISFMENQLAWHYKSPTNEQIEIALKELETTR
ncbi:transketolase [Edaphobacter albus]|uniref:transketolase n=1 Tax=Edaphobacter sp. 4G125 TaxID=2763071 RepID=UPI001647FD42|nr:transketolase [Edaphobacter sp. 4G125]QNI37181.1 transketolase [Edaphobacter sp. 4G125]